jgi:hypothetical protein
VHVVLAYILVPTTSDVINERIHDLSTSRMCRVWPSTGVNVGAGRHLHYNDSNMSSISLLFSRDSTAVVDDTHATSNLTGQNQSVF